jgi:hypothetical protein
LLLSTRGIANSKSQLRSLKYVLLPDASTDSNRHGSVPTHYTVARSQKSRRTQFLFAYAYLVQFIFMWVLSRQPGSASIGGKSNSLGDAAGGAAAIPRGVRGSM